MAKILSKYDLLAIPVLDTEELMVGIITVDDAMDVMEDEATEDITKMAAMNPSESHILRRLWGACQKQNCLAACAYAVGDDYRNDSYPL